MENENKPPRYLCKSELKQIFTDKHIKEHFPKHDKLGRNNHLSKSYSKRHNLESRLFLFSRVEAAIKAGVPHRFAKGIDKTLMHDIMILALPPKGLKIKPTKI
ncbi:TPA: hypothetical protein ACQVKY_005151 [Serratia marcescens]|uniref:Uncharacterized protein n=1 Tax=Serratia nevei TaxID=2703794 RepID=A0ABT7G5K9_9GAMM|nr:hypothetical protein [Serratia nevei]HAU4290872.1 hypothetical protein [Serratia marcescens]MDK5169044.1 hypothetical protein [Serratia nevei]MDK5298538.1 hypothetical protein [Serratia nevei]MEC5887210.1 hypothetical protein [Serratia nevei]HAU4297474.1 hypothetical protein [Serratia marcescens]